jgi:hypothetical protein
VDVAFDTTLRFLALTGTLESSGIAARLRLPAPPAPPVQQVIRVTEPVVARSMAFRFARAWKGLEVVPKAGTPVACDQDAGEEVVWRTPYDDCVMVMPSLVHLKPGTTMVRLGRIT